MSDPMAGELADRIDSVAKESRLILIKGAVKEYARFAYAMDTQAANDFANNLHATISSSSAMRR